jgi:hypothetical protein
VRTAWGIIADGYREAMQTAGLTAGEKGRLARQLRSAQMLARRPLVVAVGAPANRAIARADA